MDTLRILHTNRKNESNLSTFEQISSPRVAQILNFDLDPVRSKVSRSGNRYQKNTPKPKVLDLFEVSDKSHRLVYLS